MVRITYDFKRYIIPLIIVIIGYKKRRTVLRNGKVEIYMMYNLLVSKYLSSFFHQPKFFTCKHFKNI